MLDQGLSEADGRLSDGNELTLAGQFLGTPDFVAPEQIADAQCADILADIYSLGCTLYYLLSGRPPFQAPKLDEVLEAHRSTDARLLNFVRPEVPTELAAVGSQDDGQGPPPPLSDPERGRPGAGSLLHAADHGPGVPEPRVRFTHRAGSRSLSIRAGTARR